MSLLPFSNPNMAQPVRYPTWNGSPLSGNINAKALFAVSQLGTQTRLALNGSVFYNEPLVQQLIQMGPAAVPALQQFFQGVNNIPALLEGLYAAEKMAGLGVNVSSLTASLRRWNSHPDPLVQMNLARFYRRINDPKTLGPVLATLINQAVNQYASLASPSYNVSAEAGETVLDLIANRTADVVLQRLSPVWQTLLLQQGAKPQKQ